MRLNGEPACAVNGKLLPFMTRAAYSGILSAPGCNIPAVITSIDLDQRVPALEDAVFNDLYPRVDAMN
jgi:hypothetical protein